MYKYGVQYMESFHLSTPLGPCVHSFSICSLHSPASLNCLCPVLFHFDGSWLTPLKRSLVVLTSRLASGD